MQPIAEEAPVQKTPVSQRHRVWWRYALIAVLAVILVAVAAALLLPRVLDTPRLIALVEQHTGRTMQAEEITVSILPRLGVRLRNAHVDFAQVAEFEARLKWWPLLQQRFELHEIIAHGMRLRLARNAQGETNWAGLVSESSAPNPTAATPSANPIAQLRIDGIRLHDAEITWHDAQNGQQYAVHNLNLTTGAIAPATPVHVEADWQLPPGQSLEVTGAFQLRTDLQFSAAFDQVPNVHVISVSQFTLNGEVSGADIPHGKNVGVPHNVALAVDSAQVDLAQRTWQAAGVRLQALGAATQWESTGKYQQGVEFSATLRASPFNLSDVLAQLGQAAPSALSLPTEGQARLEGRLGAAAQGEQEGIFLRDAQWTMGSHTVRIPLARLSLAQQTVHVPEVHAQVAGAPIHMKLEGREVLGNAEWTGRIEVAEFNPAAALARHAPALWAKISASPALPLAFATAGGHMDFSVASDTIALQQVRGYVDEHWVEMKEVTLSPAQQTLAVKPLRASVLGVVMRAELRGQRLFTQPELSGRFTTQPFDARALLAQLGLPPLAMRDAKALRDLTLDAEFAATAQNANFHAVHVAVDGSQIDGHVLAQSLVRNAHVVRNTHVVPLALRFELRVDALDVDRYLPPPAAVVPPAASASTHTPLPLHFLRGLDADGTLAVGQLRAAGLRAENVTLKLHSQDGKATLTPAAQLYQGTLHGQTTLDASRAPPTLAVQQKMTGIAVAPLLTDWQRKAAPLAGKGDVDVAMRATDASSMDSLQRSLSGTVQFALADGAIQGFNLAHRLRQAQAVIRGQPLPSDHNMPEHTDFTELSGMLQGQNGVFRTHNLVMNAPFLRVQGSDGTLDLQDHTLDQRLTVHVVNTLTGQAGKELRNLENVRVPVQVAGELGQLKAKVDMAELLRVYALEKPLQRNEGKIQEKLDKALGSQAGKAVLDQVKGWLR